MPPHIVEPATEETSKQRKKPSSGGVELSQQQITAHCICTDCFADFLKHCMRQQHSASTSSNSFKLLCPVCRQPIDVPDVWRVRLGLPAASAQRCSPFEVLLPLPTVNVRPNESISGGNCSSFAMWAWRRVGGGRSPRPDGDSARSPQLADLHDSMRDPMLGAGSRHIATHLSCFSTSCQKPSRRCIAFFSALVLLVALITLVGSILSHCREAHHHCRPLSYGRDGHGEKE